MDDADRAPRSQDSGDAGDGRSREGNATRGGTDAATTRLRQEGVANAHKAELNRLLRALPLEEYEYLLPKLTSERLALKRVLVEPEVPIPDVYFIREGVGSMIATEQEGGSIEVGTIGNEGFIGLPVLLGVDVMTSTVVVQIEGDGWRLGAEEFRLAVDARPVLRRLLLRFAQYFSDQMAQSVACNRLHTLEERAARWLLMTHDRVEGDTFELTQEFLAIMLGVRRAGVTVAMGVLQSAGIIRYSRGRMTVLDRPRLEEASCSCYHITRSAYARLLDG